MIQYNSSGITEQEIEYIKSQFPTSNQRKDYIQKRSIRMWMDNKFSGSIELATGVGKTRVGIIAAHMMWLQDHEATIYILVPTKTLRDKDWPAEFKEMGVEWLLKHVTILCYDSLLKINPKKDVDLIILDEVHHLTPLLNQFFDSQNPWKVHKALGLTATLPKGTRSVEDQEKLSIINAVAPSVFKVSIEQAIELELVADFEMKVLQLPLDMTDNYVEAGTAKHPFKITELAMYTFYTKCIQKAVVRKSHGMKFKYIGLRTRFLLNLRSRVRVAIDVLNHIITPEKRTLIFCGSIEQANFLCGENVYHSQTDSSALDAFQRKELHYLAVCQALNEGKNIVDLDQILIICFNSNEKDMIQRIGRTIRFREGHKGLVVAITIQDTADYTWLQTALENFDKKRIDFINIKVPDHDLEREYASTHSK